MARFNFPSRLPRGVSVMSYPSNLIAGNERNFYTEISFIDYNRASIATEGVVAQTVRNITQGISGGILSIGGSNFSFGGNQYTPTGASIRLPIPKKLNENHILSWNELSYTDVISMFGTPGVQNRAGALGTALGGIGNLAGAGTFAARLASPFTGFNVNPFLYVYFDRPTFKQYSFTWTLAARNLNESEAIRDIVLKLKERSSPTVDGLLMKFPDLVKIEFKPDNIFGMLPMRKCVITSVQTDYTPAGPSFFKSKAPTMVNLTLNLKEVELWAQQDYTGVRGASLNNATFDAAGNIVDSTGVATESGTPEITLAP